MCYNHCMPSDSRLNIIGKPYRKYPLSTSKIKRLFIDCQCICGKIIRVMVQNLKKTRSCGCLAKEIAAKTAKSRRYNLPIKEVVDDCINGMDAVDIAKKYGCGPRVIRNRLLELGYRIKNKRGKDNKSFKGYEDISGSKWHRIKQGAISRSIPFTITIEEAWNKFCEQERKCTLTGLTLDFAKDRHSNKLSTASLDRKNNEYGYTYENCQWVHKRVNFMKSDMSEKELIGWCRLIVDKQKEKYVI